MITTFVEEKPMPERTANARKRSEIKSDKRISRSYCSSAELDGTYTADEIEFMNAMDRFKRENRRPFPKWHEVLKVLRSLGYRKCQPAQPIN